MVYVDSAPRKGALDPELGGVEKLLDWAAFSEADRSGSGRPAGPEIDRR